MAVFTTRLNLAKPAGGSSGTIPGDDQADIDVLNDNADKIDAAMGFAPVASSAKPATPFSGQPIALTDANNIGQLRVGANWVNPGFVGFGTTAQRDAYYPTPGNAAARVALAATAPRWFNTEKGYEQQYFAQFDDAGAGIFSKTVFGWAPSVTNGRVLLSNYTISKDGGVGTVTKKGAKADFAAVATIAIDSLFSNYPEFDTFEIEYSAASASVDLSMVFSLRAAAANAGAAQHTFAMRESAPGVGAESTGSAATSAVLNRVSTGGGVMTLKIWNPQSTTRRKFWTFHSTDGAGYNRIGSGNYNVPGTAFDGFRIYSGGAGSTHTGELYCYGVVKP